MMHDVFHVELLFKSHEKSHLIQNGIIKVLGGIMLPTLPLVVSLLLDATPSVGDNFESHKSLAPCLPPPLPPFLPSKIRNYDPSLCPSEGRRMVDGRNKQGLLTGCIPSRTTCFVKPRCSLCRDIPVTVEIILVKGCFLCSLCLYIFNIFLF